MFHKFKITFYVIILCLFGFTLITVSPVFAQTVVQLIEKIEKIEALDANDSARILEYLSSQNSPRDDTHKEKERDLYDTNNSMSQDEYEKRKGEVEANNQRKARLYRAYQRAERKLACMRGRKYFPLDNCSMD